MFPWAEVTIVVSSIIVVHDCLFVEGSSASVRHMAGVICAMGVQFMFIYFPIHEGQRRLSSKTFIPWIWSWFVVAASVHRISLLVSVYFIVFTLQCPLLYGYIDADGPVRMTSDCQGGLLMSCSICLEDKCTVYTPCEHWFHRKCINKWKQSTCPMCRQHIRMSLMDRLVQTVFRLDGQNKG